MIIIFIGFGSLMTDINSFYTMKHNVWWAADRA